MNRRTTRTTTGRQSVVSCTRHLDRALILPTPSGYRDGFPADPSAQHWQAIKHLLRYLVGTCHYALQIVPDEVTRRAFHGGLAIIA
jgi:hypothetical protein